MNTIYITPNGFTCTCGASQSGAAAGGQARRMAEQHSKYGHIAEMKVDVIDLRMKVGV